MAWAEQIVTDKTIREAFVFMEEAVKEGLTKEEIMSQVDLSSFLYKTLSGSLF